MSRRPAQEFSREAGLANSGFALHDNHLRLAELGGLVQLDQLGELARPPNQRSFEESPRPRRSADTGGRTLGVTASPDPSRQRLGLRRGQEMQLLVEQRAAVLV